MPNLSANCADDVASRTKTIALKEGRSISNVVENALAVFTIMPRDLRDRLLEEYQTDRKGFSGTLNTMQRLLAQQQFARSTENLAQSGPDVSILKDLSDDDLLAAATEMARGR